MGYVAKKVRDTKNGVTKVRLRDDGTPYWQLVYEDRRKGRPEGFPRERIVHRNRLESLGIDSGFTIDLVQERCRFLNGKVNAERKGERHLARILSLEKFQPILHSSYLPPVTVADFENKILLKRFSGDEKVVMLNRYLSHWKFAQRMIAHLKIQPKDYADECQQFYCYFQKEQISVGYAIKIIRVLNAWGGFYSKRHGGTWFEPLTMPKGRRRLQIARAYQAKSNYRGPADPLMPEELGRAASELSQAEYNWLHLSVWLGLRPEEVDRLKNKSNWRTKLNEDGETVELWVFQPKVSAVMEERAWKPIPLFLVEQVACLDLISSNDFKRPLHKLLRRVFPGKRITSYSGRKGFVDLMLDKGQSLENIYIWMGHATIATTWRFYKQKQAVRFKRG